MNEHEDAIKNAAFANNQHGTNRIRIREETRSGPKYQGKEKRGSVVTVDVTAHERGRDRT